MQARSARRGTGFRSKRRHVTGAPAAACVCALAVILTTPSLCFAAEPERRGLAEYREVVEPILEFYCLDCHGRGMTKADVSFNDFESDLAALQDRDLWHKALKMLNADLMPPREELQLEPEEKQALRQWIKGSVFEIDPENPDPGRVTVRRLNRVEYRNTIRDLMGVDFDTEGEFPADDTGHGFDNNADVLTISPLLLEKYLDAAQDIVAEAVPTTSTVVAEHAVAGAQFVSDEEEAGATGRRGSLTLPYREPATVKATYEIEHEGEYQLVLDFRAVERYVDGRFDYNECKLVFRADGEKLLEEHLVRQGGRGYTFTFDRELEAGKHDLTLEIIPLTPDAEDVRNLRLIVNAVTVRGPLDERYWVRPPNYERWFPRDVPDGAEQRREYARELLGDFAARAFRRPADSPTLDRLAFLAEMVYNDHDQEFEAGVAQAMTAVLASPRFLFREEGYLEGDNGRYPLIDEHALASRLSYFLWSTMPDQELTELADGGKLRDNLGAQVERMLADSRSEQFIENFVGQWLRARDIESSPVNARAVLRRENPPDPDAERLRERFRELRRRDSEELSEAERQELEEVRTQVFSAFRRGPGVSFDGRVRRAMRQETQMYFQYVIREDRSLLELLDSDYTFLNDTLAEFYEIEGVDVGNELRRVTLPPDSPRGGVLTQGTVLVTTSNPNRTSPVNRGVFMLEEILGTPPAAPPPDISPLEDEEEADDGEPLTLRESLEMHASQPLCSSCHARMDPLGLAFENFNALGRWRDDERGVPVDSSGELITGESFDGIRDLKRILANERRKDFYRAVTGKMLKYALGRGLDYYDEHTLDQMVDALEESGGRASVLVRGVIESPAFQRRRPDGYPGSVAEARGDPGRPATVSTDR